MTLTEEQRAALKRVVAYMDEMYAIASPYYGCTEDVDLLRAMTDSSEHFSDATKMIGFDLEKAREAIEEAVDRLSQKIGDEDGPIWEKEPEKAAVLQTLLDEIAHLEKWMIKNRDAATELQYQLDDAVKENERLQGFETAARDLNNDLIRIAGERDELAARIQELEDALVEERVQVIAYQIPHAKENVNWAPVFKLSRQQLRAEGKIGPDADAKPHCWQITEERKVAIKELSELLTAIGCPSCHYYIQKNYGENITVLRAMLTEADHDKP